MSNPSRAHPTRHSRPSCRKPDEIADDRHAERRAEVVDRIDGAGCEHAVDVLASALHDERLSFPHPARDELLD